MKIFVRLLFIIFWLGTSITSAQAAKLKVTPEKVQIERTKEFTFELSIDPEKAAVSAAHVHVRFDPEALEISRINFQHKFAQEYVEVTADPGKIILHFINSGELLQKNKVLLAEIAVIAKGSVTTTALTADFIQGKLGDSDVLNNKGKDVLHFVNAAFIEITPTEKQPDATPLVALLDAPVIPASPTPQTLFNEPKLQLPEFSADKGVWLGLVGAYGCVAGIRLLRRKLGQKAPRSGFVA